MVTVLRAWSEETSSRAEVGGRGRLACEFEGEVSGSIEKRERRGQEERDGGWEGGAERTSGEGREGEEKGNYLIVAQQPHARGLVVLVVGDGAVVGAHLDQVVAR
jgi:hypothetical protein